MKRFTKIVLSLMLIMSVESQADSKNAVEIGFNEIVHSNILNQDRPVQICLPASYATSSQHYPVMILCDGQWNFVHTAGIVEFVSGNGVAPEMILVGIVHDNRDDDLVPATTVPDNYSGQAADFLDFVGKELIPYIENKYRTQPFRILAGISYGGLFTHYAMITQPDLFNAYIAADPSLWWSNQKIIHESETFFKSQTNFNKTLYFTQSEIVEMGGDVFARMLQRSAPRGFKWKFNHMHQETHGSITHRSFYDGLEFIFSDWSQQPVTIEPQGNLFMEGETLVVSMSHPNAETIHYSLDGRFPDKESSIYTHSLELTKPCAIQTKAYFGHGIWGDVETKAYTYAVLQPATQQAHNLKRGLLYHIYEGEWDRLPDFTEMKPKTSGVADTIDVNIARLKDRFGIVFEGYVDIPETAIYTFFLNSDDGSRLCMDNQLVIDNDGLHAEFEKTKQLYLEKGMHSIKVDFFEKGGGEVIELNYEKSGSPRQSFSADRLFHP